MNEPTFKPDEWVIFKQDTLGGFGQIIGGTFDGNEWQYIVKNSLIDGTHRSVSENEITHTLENGNWSTPTHFGGAGSAYTP